MANTIIDLGGGEKIVRMSNARFARLPEALIFSGWVTLRLALRLKITDSGGNLTGTPRFAWGFCAGTTNIMGDTSVDHFVGLRSYSGTWTRSTTETRYGTVNITGAKQVGATVTDASASGAVHVSLFHVNQYKLFFCDITKGSPNYTFNGFSPTSNSTSNPTASDFLTQSVLGSPAFTGHAAGTNRTLAVDEGTDGTLNACGVWWNQTASTIDIADMRVVQLA